jgi:2-desacetyl-2-hydroxyethyl bacteriochlorophyllide A dehydrogenase
MTIDGTMQVVSFHEYGGPEVLQSNNVPIPQPRRDEVLLRVKACGVNRADLLSRMGKIIGEEGLPHIPGTEVAGEVVRVGSLVRDRQPGERVMVNPTLYCGECASCKTGEDNLCTNGKVFGFDTKGGYAEYVTAPARYLVNIPQSVAFETAAALAATASTSWNMLVRKARLKPGETVLIVAAGSGIGVYAVQIARLMGARVIATAGSQEKREKALALGAEVVFDHNTKGWSQQVRTATGGRGVDVVFEHVGEATWQESIRTLSRMGRLVTCGAFTGSKVLIDLWPLFAKELELIGSFGASFTDLEQVLELAAVGSIQPVLHAKLPLSQAIEAHRMLEKREVFGTIVLIPNNERR